MNVETVVYDEKHYLIKEAVATYFEVDIRTIERYISSNGDELKDSHNFWTDYPSVVAIYYHN